MKHRYPGHRRPLHAFDWITLTWRTAKKNLDRSPAPSVPSPQCPICRKEPSDAR